MARLNVKATLIHRTPVNGKKYAWTRHYRDITTAVAKATALLIRDGYVGDVVEICLLINSMQAAAVKMTAAGRVVVEWDHDRAIQSINAALANDAERSLKRLDAMKKRK